MYWHTTHSGSFWYLFSPTYIIQLHQRSLRQSIPNIITQYTWIVHNNDKAAKTYAFILYIKNCTCTSTLHTDKLHSKLQSILVSGVEPGFFYFFAGRWGTIIMSCKNVLISWRNDLSWRGGGGGGGESSIWPGDTAINLQMHKNNIAIIGSNPFWRGWGGGGSVLVVPLIVLYIHVHVLGLQCTSSNGTNSSN